MQYNPPKAVTLSSALTNPGRTSYNTGSGVYGSLQTGTHAASSFMNQSVNFNQYNNRNENQKGRTDWSKGDAQASPSFNKTKSPYRNGNSRRNPKNETSLLHSRATAKESVKVQTPTSSKYTNDRNARAYKPESTSKSMLLSSFKEPDNSYKVASPEKQSSLKKPNRHMEPTKI